MPAESWTREQIDLLRQLWNEGLTAAAIAARLGGLSRSAVLGKVSSASAAHGQGRGSVGSQSEVRRQSAAPKRRPPAGAAAANAASTRKPRRLQSGNTRRCLN